MTQSCEVAIECRVDSFPYDLELCVKMEDCHEMSKRKDAIAQVSWHDLVGHSREHLLKVSGDTPELNASLPAHWEARKTPIGGRVHYVDHITHTTSWDRPRALWHPPPGQASTVAVLERESAVREGSI